MTDKKLKLTSKTSDLFKSQFEQLFRPWLLTKIRKTEFGLSFTVEIIDPIVRSVNKDRKKFNFQCFTIGKNEKAIKLTSEQLKLWTKLKEPTIIGYIRDEEKLGYIQMDDHFLNTLISENPSRSASDIILLPTGKFRSLNKRKIKEIREFVSQSKRTSFSVLESGAYFKYKDALKHEVSQAVLYLHNLNLDINIQVLNEIDEDINKAIYTVAIVGATKAGKSTIINSLVSKYVSPVDIRPTTGIPTNIVPGKEEKTEILLNDGSVITGPAEESFLNQYVAIDQNRSNHKKVKMVTVWVKSNQMEKGLSFCDFPGLDDADPIIEKTVENALNFVNAIIYVVDSSSMPSGFKFTKYHRDDLLKLKNKDNIFLVFNKIDSFKDPKLLADFKNFINDELDRQGLKSLFAYAPIYMDASQAFSKRDSGVYEKDEMNVLESQVWDYLLANSKSGLHNLLNIIGQVSQESVRLSRTLSLRILQGDQQKKLRDELLSTQVELRSIKSFERKKRIEISNWLSHTLNAEKNYLIQYYRNFLNSIGVNNDLPDDAAVKDYLIDQLSSTAPEIFDQLEGQITQMHNDLNTWVNEKLQPVEITIDRYTKHQFRESDEFNQILQPISHIFSETYGKSVPTGMLDNIAYHIINLLEWFGESIWELFTDINTVRKSKINGIVRRLQRCYDETFDKIYFAFNTHLEFKCNQLLSKVVDRTDLYIASMNNQISELNAPLSLSEKKLHTIAMEKLADLDNQCNAIKLEIEEQTTSFNNTFVPKHEDTLKHADSDIEKIEKELRKLINDRLVKNMSTDDPKKIILAHLQPKLQLRIDKTIRDHPGCDKKKFNSLSCQLEYFDMSEYFELISNKTYWPFFVDVFNSKEHLNKHIIQLSNFRNAIRHSREQTQLIIAEGSASILWFKMALQI